MCGYFKWLQSSHIPSEDYGCAESCSTSGEGMIDNPCQVRIGRSSYGAVRGGCIVKQLVA